MSELKIRVRNRTAVIADCPSIYAGSANIDTITADLDDEWTGYTVSALFICGDDVYQIPINQTITGAVLEASGLIRIGLIGVNGTAKIATNLINFRLPEGASFGDNLSDSDRKTMMDLYQDALAGGSSGGSGSGSGTQKGIAGVTQYYLSSSSSSTSSVTHSSSGWTTTRPTPTSSSPYIWTYTKIELEDGTSVKTAPIIQGNYNERLGAVSMMFLRNSSATAPSTSASGWSTNSAEPTASQPYVWCYIRLTYYAYGTASSHYVNSSVFRMKTYQESSGSGEVSPMVLESNGCGGFLSYTGADILAAVQKGVTPVVYSSGFYSPVICTESTTLSGQDAIKLWYYYGGCSTPTLSSTTVVI